MLTVGFNDSAYSRFRLYLSGITQAVVANGFKYKSVYYELYLYTANLFLFYAWVVSDSVLQIN